MTTNSSVIRVFFAASLAAGCLFASCSKYQDKLDILEDKVSSLDTALSSISLASANPVELGFGASAQVPFRINPSNASFNPKIFHLKQKATSFPLKMCRKYQMAHMWRF